jgi:hypothetical protein
VADSSKNQKIASGIGGGPGLTNGDMFGAAVAALGDLDGDGIEDMAVGAPSQRGSGSAGAVSVLFMNADGTVNSSQRIASAVGGGPALADGDYFGHSMAAIGDLDGDGITDLAVGADKDDTGGYNRGAVHVLFLNAIGTVKSSQKIAHGVNGGPAFANGDRFGSAIASLGDLDGDGITDLAVGAAGDDTGGDYRGAVFVLFMNAAGTVKTSQKIASGVGGGPTLANGDVFGIAVASLGDLDGDGVGDLAASAFFDDTGGAGRGAMYVLFLNSDGSVKSSQRIGSGVGGGPALDDGDYFGRSVASLGDLDGDGLSDLAVGAYRDDTGGADRGALHILLLNANGTVKQSSKIASGIGGGPNLANDDRFGSGVTTVGDLNSDGVIDLAVGAELDDTGGNGRGAVHVLFLTPQQLLGDYNDNGTVDVADYVVWRNALGSAVVLPNDSTPGTVTQADYDVWRANFGRSLVAVAEARVLADASQPTVAGSEGREFLGQLAARDSHSIVDPSVLPHVEFSPPSSRAAAGRPTPRSAFGHDSARDEALIAWLASRHIEPDPGSRAWELANTMPETTPNDRIEQPSDVLALALAAL